MRLLSDENVEKKKIGFFGRIFFGGQEEVKKIVKVLLRCVREKFETRRNRSRKLFDVENMNMRCESVEWGRRKVQNL